MSGDFYHRNCGMGVPHVERDKTTKHPTMHGTAPLKKELSSPEGHWYQD